MIERGGRGIKSRTALMLGFKNFGCAGVTLAGLELVHRIRKNQFALGCLRIKDQTPSAIWECCARRVRRIG